MKKYNAYLIIILLTVALSLTSCGGKSASVTKGVTPTPEPTTVTERGIGDTLRILYWQAPTILNPHLTVGQKDWGASRIVYEPLASFNEKGDLIPFLAAKIPSLSNRGVAQDGKSVTWKLKQNIKWSDGEPFTANDVLFTYEFITNPDTGATTTAVYDAVQSVKVIDDYTVKINFKDVTPGWFLPFVGVQGMIIPRHIFEPYNGTNAKDAPSDTLIGTGPYWMTSFKPQEVLFLGSKLVETNKLVYEPNRFFREANKPYFSKIILRGGGTVEEATRSILEVGDVDFALNLQLNAKTLDKMVNPDNKGTLLVPFGSFVERILLNRTDPNKATEDGERSNIQFKNPILYDKQVRQALTYAINRKAIAKLYGVAGRATSTILVSPGNYRSPNNSYEFNLEKASQLLDKAGWIDSDGDNIRDKDGVKMSLSFQTSANAIRQETQRIIQNDLASIGIEVELKIIPASVFFSKDPSNPDTRFHFYTDFEEFSTANRSPDPGAYMKSWTCGEITQKKNDWSGANIERWCNKAYDKLYEQSTTEMNIIKRAQIFIKMNDLLVNDVVVIPLVHRANASGVNNSIEGIELSPWDAASWNIKDWRRAE